MKRMDPVLSALLTDPWELNYARELLLKAGNEQVAVDTHIAIFLGLCNDRLYKKTWDDFHRYLDTIQ